MLYWNPAIANEIFNPAILAAIAEAELDLSEKSQDYLMWQFKRFLYFAGEANRASFDSWEDFMGAIIAGKTCTLRHWFTSADPDSRLSEVVRSYAEKEGIIQSESHLTFTIGGWISERI